MSSIRRRSGKKAVSYVVTYDLGAHPATGKRQQKKASFDRRKDAEAFKTRVDAARRSGDAVSPAGLTVADLLTRWLDARRASGANRASTIRNYRASIDGQIVPRIGALPLDKLAPLDVQAVIDAARAETSADAASRCYIVLDMALRQAVKWRLIAHSPVAGTIKPVIVREPVAGENVWSEEQAATFLAETRDEPHWPLWYLALHTGMRAGEITALGWEHVDFARGTVAVARTWARDERSGWEMHPPKTRLSRRTLEVGPSVMAFLSDVRRDQIERRLRAGELWRDGGFVFDRGDGTPHTPLNLATRLRARCRWVGLPEITFHGLRHSFATAMLRRGVHARIVQHFLGHSTAAMTAHYQHVMPMMHRAIADAAAAAFGSGGASSKESRDDLLGLR